MNLRLTFRSLLIYTALTALLPFTHAAADTTNYYWRDGQGNGRWDWDTSQWFVDGGGIVGAPRSDGGAILFFQGNGTTDTFINSGFSSGYFNLNSIILDSGSAGRSDTITPENGGTGIQIFNKIETQSGSGSLTVNAVTQLGSDVALNAFGGTITLAQVQTNGKTLTVDGGSSISFSDVINTPGTGSVQKNGTGTLTFGGSSDNLNAGVSVNGGTLLLNKSSSSSVHAVGAGLTVNSSGTVSLGGTGGDQIYSGSFVTINNGGTFKTNGNSEGSSTGGSTPGVGALTLQGGSTLDFASGANGSVLSAASGVVSGAGDISILNWTGTLFADNGTGTNDRLLFQSDPGFAAGQLAQFQFYDDSGIALGIGATEIAFNGWTEIVPAPEASTWISAALSAAALGVFSLRKRRLLRRRR
jgi:autotransporter-associated beta strand protein